MYGAKKIGKTTLAAQFPDTFFLFFEPGIGELEVHAKQVTSWMEFVSYLDLLEEDESYKTVVIDTVDVAYNLCFEYTCAKNGFEHPGDRNDFGKSWSLIKKEFMRQFRRLFRLKKGTILISHAKDREFETKHGKKYNRIVSTMSGQAHDYINGEADIWFFYGYEGEDRVITLKGSDYVSAGSRLRTRFRTPDGERIGRIPCGNDEEETYENLIAAFQNEQWCPSIRYPASTVCFTAQAPPSVTGIRPDGLPVKPFRLL